MYVKVNCNVQRGHSSVFLVKLQLTTTLYVIKYLCACDGSVHNSFDIQVMHGTLSAREERTDIIHCTMHTMGGKDG